MIRRRDGRRSRRKRGLNIAVTFHDTQTGDQALYDAIHMAALTRRRHPGQLIKDVLQQVLQQWGELSPQPTGVDANVTAAKAEEAVGAIARRLSARDEKLSG